MSNPTLVPGSDRLEVLSLTADQGTIILTARTGGDTAQCPICGQLSTRVHSRYRRTLADLPWQEIPARLMLWSRRFFCDTASCPRRIFTERLPGIVAPHARRTDRLGDWLRHIAFALGGEPGARLLRQLGVTVCGDTLLARIRADLSPAQPTPRVLSVDDFAFRRSRPDAPTAASWSTSNGTGLSTSSPTGAEAAWPRGCAPIPASISSAGIAAANMPTGHAWVRPRPCRSLIVSTSCGTCAMSCCASSSGTRT